MEHSVRSAALSKWVYAFIFTHLIIWTLAPSLTRYNLPLDSIEGTLWSSQLAFGYDKNPFLNAWLIRAILFLAHQDWLIYFLSQLSVAIGFLAVWQLARQLLPLLSAIVAVLILEAIQYYNFHAIDFNDNTLQLSLWPLTIYFFYRAGLPKHNGKEKLFDWLATAFFAAFALMAKYYAVILFCSMLLFFFSQREMRNQLKTINPYLALMLFLLLITPHFIWLFQHNFITVHYVFARAYSSPQHWFNHLLFPLQFMVQQFEVILPALFIILMFLLGSKKNLQAKIILSTYQKHFIFTMALGPLLITLLLSFLFGINLRAGWGMPLFSLWGLFLLILINPAITEKKFNFFIGGIFLLLLVLASCYCLVLKNTKTYTSAHFPGKEMAFIINKKWHDAYHTRLAYVAGSRWLGGNVSFYSKDKPSVFPEWNLKHGPWINEQDLADKGAIFIWDITEGEQLPEHIRKKYQLEREQIVHFAWKGAKKTIAPVQIGLAFLPPKPPMEVSF